MADVRTLSKLLDRWLTIIAKKPLATLMVLIAITVVVAARLPGIHFSASLHDLIVDGSPERQHYDRFKTLFGNDAIVQVVVKGNDFFSVHDFEGLGRVSEALAGIPGVARVVSLPQIKTAVDPRSQWDLRRFAAVTAPVDVFQRHLISPDHRVAGITLILADDANQASVTRNPERTNPSARPC